MQKFKNVKLPFANCPNGRLFQSASGVQERGFFAKLEKFRAAQWRSASPRPTSSQILEVSRLKINLPEVEPFSRQEINASCEPPSLGMLRGRQVSLRSWPMRKHFVRLARGGLFGLTRYGQKSKPAGRPTTRPVLRERILHPRATHPTVLF